MFQIFLNLRDGNLATLNRQGKLLSLRLRQNMKESYFVYFFLGRLIQNSKTCRKKEKLMLNGKSVCSSMLPVVFDLAKDKNRHLSRHGVKQLNKLISAPRKTDRRICSGKLSFVTVDIILTMYLYFIILF